MSSRSASRLFEHVAFDERQKVSDGHGNYEGDFLEAFQCRAGFTYLRGTESVIAARLEGRQPIVVRVRASSNTRQIDRDWRMRDLRDGQWVGASGEDYWDGPVYAVRSVIPTEDRRYIDITVEQGVAA